MDEQNKTNVVATALILLCVVGIIITITLIIKQSVIYTTDLKNNVYLNPNLSISTLRNINITND